MSTFMMEQEIKRLMYLTATNPQPDAYDVMQLEELVRQARQQYDDGSAE